jgi:ATP-dependent DNA helicase RecG
MDKIEFVKLLNELRSQTSETEWLEFKKNNIDPDEIGEYIAALSNSACLHDKAAAYLVFGIADKTHEIVGTSFRPKQSKIGNEELENWLVRSLNPRIDFKIVESLVDDNHIVIFIIDPAHNRPVAFKNTAFIRVGSYKKKLDDYAEKERKIWQKGKHVEFDKDIALKNVSSDDVFQLLNFSAYYDLMKLIPPSNMASVLDKFQEEKFIKKSGNHFSILNLGAILFAKNLDAFENLSRKAIRIIIYKGASKLETIKEKLITKGYATGIQDAIDYVNDQLPQNEELGRVFRKEVKMFPEVAVRELVINAVMHQDFHIKGAGPMVEIFDERLEITNPGIPLIDTLRFIDSIPVSRNELLAKMMRRTNLSEERGSGVDKIIGSIEAYQLPAPNFIKGENFLRAVLYAHKALKVMDKNDKVRACFQHCALKYVSGELMTNKSLRERFNVSEKNYSAISRIIADTIEVGLIKIHDDTSKSKKYAKYAPFWA